MQFFDIRTSKNCPLRACFVHFHSQTCFSPQRRAIFRHRNFKKCSESVSFFYILTWKCAFRHSGVQFSKSNLQKSAPNLTCFVHFRFKLCFSPQPRAIFSTSELQKSARNLTCFVHVHFDMCCSPQRRAIFRHQNSKKCSEPGAFCTFSLQNALFATTACNFWSLTTWLRTRRFNRPTFQVTRHTHHWKNTTFRDFSNIWRGCIFFLLTFALLHLLSADLTTLLCFSTVHIVGSQTSKLPSISFANLDAKDRTSIRIWELHRTLRHLSSKSWPYQWYRTRRWRKFQEEENYRRDWLLWVRDVRAN